MVLSLRIATCRPLPEPDPDEAPLVDALSAAGIGVQLVPWRSVDVDWDAPVPTLVRSTWDYVHGPDEFRQWIERVARAAPLWNPGPVLLGNIHKGYLLELAAKGVPAVPTVLLGRGASAEEIVASLPQGALVIKPAVGAASLHTRRFRAEQRAEALAFAVDSAARSDTLIQPYMDAVERSGERALVYVDGCFTHAVRKAPRFAGDRESVSAALSIAPDEMAVAEAALEGLEGLVYARVDLVRDRSGAPVLMELEAIEPSLFLVQHPPALDRLVAGLLRRLRA